MRLIIAIFLLIISVKNHACECNAWPESIFENVERSGEVFSGTVRDIKFDKEKHSYEIDIEVEKNWKGKKRARTTVFTPGGKACGFSFQSNKKYIVFTSLSVPHQVNSCSKTKEWSKALVELEFLQKYERWFSCKKNMDCTIVEEHCGQPISVLQTYAKDYLTQKPFLSCKKKFKFDDLKKGLWPLCISGKCEIKNK